MGNGLQRALGLGGGPSPRSPRDQYPGNAAGRPRPQPSVIGRRVLVHGLRQSPSLNGREGIVVGIQGDRLQVDFGEAGVKAVRSQNLSFADRGWCYSCGRVVPTARLPGGGLRCMTCQGDFVELLSQPLSPEEARAFTVGGAASLPPSAGVPDQWQPVGVGGFMPGVMLTPGAMFGVDALQRYWEQMAAAAAEEQGPPPASTEAIQKLERFEVDEKLAAMGHNEKLCVVCQDDMAKGDRGIRMPCGHIFHDECILPWLRQHNTCPTCRHAVPPAAEQRNMPQFQFHPGPFFAHAGGGWRG